ncbi:restriction endonuclease subunit S [Aliiroseovarius crassostreae]|uniref:restriction endonuclease subunit S n=1 Tax=Aliiroseovarius crassostreae TaxID=154981 RepID=UPI0021AFAEF6|nr:restriction endonuclease subunit S [Aliiroseovarius crassostreae]UWQ01039.1 restriction endonuclease subunit S [Aliiroseovarius crassostreae]
MTTETFTVEELINNGVLAPPMDGNHGSIHPKTVDYVETGIPFVMASDLVGGHVDTVNCAFLSEDQANSLRKGFSKTGDVLLSHKATIGRTAIVGPLETDFIMLTPQITYYRVLDEGRLDRRYLYYYFNSRPFQELLGQWAGAGSTRAYLGITGQRKLPIVVPEPSVQKDIVGRLGALDDKIELNRRMNETLEEMARALFRDWFVTFGPTRRQMEGATDPAAIMGHAFPPEKAATLAPLFPAKLGDDGSPEGWETRPLNTVVEQQKQSVKPDQHLDETFEHFSLPAFDKAKWPTRERGAEIKSNKTAVPANSLLVSKLNPRIQRVWVPQVVGEHRQICSTEFLCFMPAAGLGRATVETLFRSDEMREKMAAMVTGTSNSHQRVPPKVLMQADVLLPEACAKAFEEVARPLLHKRQANEQENQTLAEMRDLLLPKLMSGEIRLKDAEASK